MTKGLLSRVLFDSIYSQLTGANIILFELFIVLFFDCNVGVGGQQSLDIFMYQDDVRAC